MSTLSAGAAVVLDADVLHRANVRDVLLRLAYRGLLKPRWSVDILDELVRSLEGRGYSAAQTSRLTRALATAFPDALVSRYADSVERISLPDSNDRHVVAVAVKANCHHIVTYNTRHFPAKALAPLGIVAVHPDQALMVLWRLERHALAATVDELLAELIEPPISFERFVDGLRRQGLTRFAAALVSMRTPT
jgi:predicted nucleic acid-binding protein